MHTSNPDHICQQTVAIEQHVLVARDTYRLRLPCPSIAAHILPGQFLMLRLPSTNDPLLGRPLALYDTYCDASGLPRGVDIVYQAIGRMTRRLATIKAGDRLEMWGPLGNGFPPVETEHLIMAAGGIGQTPFLALARHYLGLGDYGRPPRAVPRAKKVTLCYGHRSSAFLAGVDDFRRLGVEVLISTDDGSAGHCGTVVDLLPPVVEASPYVCRVVACGSGEDAARHGEDGRQDGPFLPGFVGKPNGLWDRNLFQLRDEDPRREGRVGLSPDLHGRADIQRGGRRVLILEC